MYQIFINTVIYYRSVLLLLQSSYGNNQDVQTTKY